MIELNGIEILWVGLGGACGAVLRYTSSLWIKKRFPSTFPYGTLTVNFIGSILIGFFWSIQAIDSLFFTIGLLGAFTTFSTWIWELVEMLQANNYRRFMIYSMISLFMGLAGVTFGYYLVEVVHKVQF